MFLFTPDSRHSRLLNSKWQQRHIAGALNGNSQLPLVPGTVSCDPPRQNFPPLCNELPQSINILVVNILDLVNAEAADLLFAFSPLSSQKSHLHTQF